MPETTALIKYPRQHLVALVWHHDYELCSRKKFVECMGVFFLTGISTGVLCPTTKAMCYRVWNLVTGVGLVLV